MVWFVYGRRDENSVGSGVIGSRSGVVGDLMFSMVVIMMLTLLLVFLYCIYVFFAVVETSLHSSISQSKQPDVLPC
jgi:uncharacterized membrane protein